MRSTGNRCKEGKLGTGTRSIGNRRRDSLEIVKRGRVPTTPLGNNKRS